jgi:hypothetical protein
LLHYCIAIASIHYSFEKNHTTDTPSPKLPAWKMSDPAADTKQAQGAATNKNDDDPDDSNINMKTEKKRRLGRKGRRKQRRIAEIEAAAAAAAQANGKMTDQSPATTTIIPQDRDHQWPAVRELCSLEDADKQSLVAQLGYYPGNAVAVAARANEAFPATIFKDDSTPLVLKLYPLVLRDESDSTKGRRKRKRQQQDNKASSEKGGDGDDDDDDEASKKKHLVEPFPTMFWVTHPRLRALISKIEIENRGSQYEKILQNDAKALESMKKAHLAYGTERLSMITSQDREYLAKRRWESAVDISRGVAGIRNYSAIKCLHAHAAHFWSGCQDNVVGQWVAEEVLSLLQGGDSGAKH